MAKRISILAGHYGSGKTNIAVNLALNIRNAGKNVAVADLDIVNPYFRTKDSEEDFEKAGIRLISSEYANTNLDAPALPQAMYAVIDDKDTHFVIDVGGDDRGALALGRLTDAIVAENDYEMYMVINFYRPLTQDVASMSEVMKEMEVAAGMKFTGIINNSNIGEETKAADVLDSVERAKAFSKETGLPIVMTTVREDLFAELSGKIENLFSLKLQKKYYL
ncbi:MAG: hypothetical protein IJP24_02485 [Firmicutes bacterium]|nr:hypothetical protein [Bacillota bacterium]